MPEPSVTELAKQVADTQKLVLSGQTALNIVWTLLTGFLVMFMQAGFALVETGLTRAKNVAHTMGMNFLVYSIGIVGFWVLGFGLQMGGVGPLQTFGNDPTLSHEFVVTIAGKAFGLFGTHGFFLTPAVYTAPVEALFLFQMVFMDTAATIPTGAMAVADDAKLAETPPTAAAAAISAPSADAPPPAARRPPAQAPPGMRRFRGRPVG